jgi:hypothetical protein
MIIGCYPGNPIENMTGCFSKKKQSIESSVEHFNHIVSGGSIDSFNGWSVLDDKIDPVINKTLGPTRHSKSRLSF